MTLFLENFPTPFGDFSIAVDETGAVIATTFGDPAAFRAQFSAHQLSVDKSKTAEARRQVLAYFAGSLHAFELPLAPVGTDFQQLVWAALREIPFGETLSYGELAAAIGRPQAARAVGRANATNPICLIVPCHRVIGADGSLTGFALGEELKRRLLEHEGALVPA